MLMEQIQALGKLFSRRWWVTTLLIIAGVIILMRLGVWQLARRDYKRSLNEMMAERWQMAPFNLNQATLPPNLVDLQYRHIAATGKFDYAHQIIVKNDTRNDLPGVNLITPLVLDGNRAILVARGWIPMDQAAPDKWAQYDEKTEQSLVGLIRESQTLAGVSVPKTISEQAPLKDWWRVDIKALQAQMPYKLLPAFIEMLPEPGRKVDALPLRADEPAPYDELEHTSYAWQWFTFGVILAFGYIQLIVQQERKARRLQGQAAQTEKAEGNEVELTAAPHNV